MRIEFDGTRNVDYGHVLQYVLVRPNTGYRFSGYMRTDAITTDSGLRFQIFDASNFAKMFAATENAVGTESESPAFAEGQTEENLSPEGEQRTKAKTDDQLQRQPSLSIPERRQHPRRQILLFTYAVLGKDNGGLVFNLGEGGLALTAAAPLQEHHFAKMRVRFPDSAYWFETSGYLAWKSDSGKEAGIGFADLPEDTRFRIKQWVSQGESPGDLSSKEDEVRTTQNRLRRLPSFMEPDDPSREPFDIPEEQQFEDGAFQEHRFEERTRPPAPSSSALFKTGIKGVFERASVRRQVAKIKPPRHPDYSVKPRTRVTSKALSIAAGVALAVGGWLFFQRTSWNEAGGIIAHDAPTAQSSQEPARKPDVANTDVGAVEPPVAPSVQQVENASKNVTTQPGIANSSAPQIENESPALNNLKTPATSPNTNSQRASKQKPRSEEFLANIPPASSAQRRSDSRQRPAPSQRELKTKSPQITASAPVPSSESKPVESKPVESKPVQTAQASPAQNKDLNATRPSLSSNPPQPVAAPPPDISKEKPMEKENLLVTPKQPEAPLARTPLVTISFDPYPSIRMPKAEKSKKSQQGKSLQMGRLLMRVDPVYPEEAKQQGIEGTVRVHAIFNREGTVQSVISESGPPLLRPAAMNAVRQWRFSQTILGGQAMETEEEVTVQFRLANSASKN